MIRTAFFLILLLHGLIHLMGFAKAFQFAEISGLTQPVGKPAGAAWGLTALLFTVTAALFILKKEGWWMWAVPAVVISQILIFTSWQDAKFGTLANMIAVVGLIIGYGQWHFNNMVNSELHEFFTQKTAVTNRVTEEKIAVLPPIVQTWLRHTGAVGKPAASTVHLRQSGEMRTVPDGKWMPVEAEQYFTLKPPGFVWLADVRAAPGIHLAGRDRYVDGHGHMLIKVFSLVPVANAKGPEIDQGTLLRFLSEIVWFPSAALEDYIQWESVDAHAAKATMNYKGLTASGVFRFSPDGDMVSFDAERYYDRKGGATLEHWHIAAKAWKELDGVRMPIHCEVTWKLKEGDFTWYKLEITNLKYDEKIIQ